MNKFLLSPHPLHQLALKDYTDEQRRHMEENLENQILAQRAATLYENREQVAIVPRGRVEPLPFVDTLLDPYVVHQA